MKKVVVIGLNNFGMEIARQFTSSGAKVMAIDKNKDKISKISSDVAHTLFLNGLEISKLMEVKFYTYNGIVVVMTESMDLSLAVLILFKSLAIKNVIICAENDDQEKVAKIFLNSNDWPIVRLDKQVANYMKIMIDDLEKKNKI